MLHDHIVASVMALSPVRPGAVDRAREHLGSGTWCKADEVAAELIACLVERRLP
jgi:hypothetical protein